LHPRTTLRPTQVYQRLDQPLLSIETYKKGLDKFPGESSLLVATARVYEGALGGNSRRDRLLYALLFAT